MLPIHKLLTTNFQQLTKRKKGLATFSEHERGFTLIEMLVVIAIISILIGIGINTFTIAQKKARDVRRKADLRNIQTALELYYQDHGSYPGGCSAAVCAFASDSSAPWIPVLAPYLPSIPTDPINKFTTGGPHATYGYAGSSGNPIYTYITYHNDPTTNVASEYQLLALLENGQDADACSKKNYTYTTDTGATGSWCSAGQYSGNLYVVKNQ